MKLETFIEMYDRDGAVVLLEGKRTVLLEDRDTLTALGKLLCRLTKRMRFRSGNASGSDELFSRGIIEVDANRLEVITPYQGHRAKYNQAGSTYNLDEVDLAQEPEVLYETRKNKGAQKLVDRYLDGHKDRVGMKAAYLLRDTIKVTGTATIPPATFGLFYDDLNAPMTGGTGHTMKVCSERNIPFINQEIWMKWLKP